MPRSAPPPPFSLPPDRLPRSPTSSPARLQAQHTTLPLSPLLVDAPLLPTARPRPCLHHLYQPRSLLLRPSHSLLPHRSARPLRLLHPSPRHIDEQEAASPAWTMRVRRTSRILLIPRRTTRMAVASRLRLPLQGRDTVHPSRGASHQRRLHHLLRQQRPVCPLASALKPQEQVPRAPRVEVHVLHPLEVGGASPQL